MDAAEIAMPYKTSTSFYITSTFVAMFLYPMMTAIAILLIVNILIFPEFGATGLG